MARGVGSDHGSLPTTKSLPGPGEVRARLDLSGRDPTQGFCLINQQPKSNLKNPLKKFNSCQEGELDSKNKPQNVEHQEKPTTAEATGQLPSV